MTSCISLSMASFGLNIIICLSMLLITLSLADDFYQNYYPLWGQNHISVINQNNQNTEVQLLLDQSSGAGFKSKVQYGYGIFTMRIKIPKNRTIGGVITAFYVIQDDQLASGNHDEIDFEFIGTEGRLQTNLFANDMGGREQTFLLPFDPSEDYHTYQILYSPHHIVWFVDNIPIRAFQNNTMRGVNYPSRPMWAESSLWYSNAVNWAGPIDWNQEPFIAHYQDFNISTCPSYQPVGSCIMSPAVLKTWNTWNRPKVDLHQLQLMWNFRQKHMIYDYCKHRGARYPECPHTAN